MNKEQDTVRLSLRLPKWLCTEIDQLRSDRPGSISRNTWIAEAIKEKLERDDNVQLKEQGQ
ncbi:hypothetical protein [Escherichia coli]|jgi:metal-responsive CopG/Arc/MetJ family transcriptional regulator|uniref:hypothetical protein n=1 Tax=Escherichia coli TaxID=562 RepID=UPI00287459A1|nr:hypothetical protein [Escherichia coli]MDS0773422.1 hypothetical protein [Escherichia coli]MDT3795447.1 hypothetical protein [Escherichia coli]